MSEGGNIIIIKGGSVSISFDDTLFPKNPHDPLEHNNANLKIKQIMIQGINGYEYDSGYHPEGLKSSIMVVC